MKGILQTHQRHIVDQTGRRVFLKGINLGGWLMPEAYFMHAPNFSVHKFQQSFQKTLGKKAMLEFNQHFRQSWIKKNDFENIRRMGFNCVRLPFHYKLVEKKANVIDVEGVKFLKKVVGWAKQHDLKIILDLHAAPGAQNHDWHSDSDGRARLWTSAAFQKRTFNVWEKLADTFKDSTTVAGYDLLNEAVVYDTRKLNRFYHQLIGVIRGVDKKHILFVEGNKWAQDISCLDDFNDDHYALSIHNYEPLDFTFNFVPNLTYPLPKWNKTTTGKLLAKKAKIAKKRQRPLFCGEFGVNSRGGKFGEDRWLDDVLSVFEKNEIHWTYWTYKAVKNFQFPDGAFSYYPNSPWVSRHGPLSGWETYAQHWPTKKRKMVQSWKTQAFSENDVVTKVLKKHVR